MVNLEQIRTVIETVLASYRMQLTDLRWISQPQPTLEISVMDENYQFDLDTAEFITEHISLALDEANLIEGSYYLDIGSPGAERELKGIKDLEAHLEDYVYCKLKDPKAGLHEVEGYLKEVTSEHIKIKYREMTRQKEVTIDHENIAMIRLAVKL